MSQESLVRFIESRSRSDFDAFVRSSRARTLKTAERICRNRELAADLVQELHTSLFLEPPGLDEVRQLRLYLTMRLLGLARTRKRCEVRRAVREERHCEMRSVVVSEPGPEDAWDVNEAVAGLPQSLREVVEMRYYAELQVQEIAATLETTPRTVLNRITRAAGILRTKLASSVAAVVCAALVGQSQAEAAASRPRHPALTAALGAAAILLVTAGGTWLWHKLAPGLQAGPVVADSGNAGDAAGTPAVVARRVAPAGEKTAPVSNATEPPARGPRPGDEAPVAAVRTSAPAMARLALSVVDETGAPVAGGTVDFSPSARTNLQRGLARIAGALGLPTTIPSRALPASGRLELDLPQALQGFAVAVKVTAPGFVGHREASFTPRPGRTEELTVTLAQALDVTVLVLDAQGGEPVAGALVEVDRDPGQVPREIAPLTRLTGPPRDPAGRTDAAGRILLPAVRERLLALTVDAPGYWSVRAEEVEPLETVTLWLHERADARTTGTLAVRVLDPAGRPWPRARLKIDGLPADQRSRATDDSGTLRLEDIDPGFYIASLEPPPFEATQEFLDLERSILLYRHATVELKPGEDVELVLRPADRTCSARIALVDAAGRPCPGLAVRLGEPLKELATTDQRGLAHFRDQEPGRHSIFAGREESWVAVGEVELVPRSEVQVRCELGPGILRGKIVDEQGQPLAGASILGQSPRRTEAASDTAGRFEIRGLTPGRCELLIVPREAGLAPQRLAVDIAGQGAPTSITVTLRKGGQVGILATTPDGLPLGDLRAGLKVTDDLGEQLVEHHGGQRETEFRTRSPLEPGEHVILLGGPGRKPQELRVEVEPGEVTVVRVTLEAAPPAPAEPSAPATDPASIATGE